VANITVTFHLSSQATLLIWEQFGNTEVERSDFKKMLVFFLHGVATKDADYSKPLQTLLREEFNRFGQPLPHFYAGFWGNVLKQTGQMWNWIHRDLQNLKSNNPQADIQDVFRYQEIREDLVSQFFGDALTYFNTERGLDIRDTIADQLYKFLKHHPQETDLHIVSHSLGSVILWDILFSNRFACDDPAHTIRSLIAPCQQSSSRKIRLKSLTTMGSPILFFNLMLGVAPEQIKTFTATYQEAFRWINLIHASDIIAYPLQSSLSVATIPNLLFRDRFILADANGAEKTARFLGQTHAAMAMGASDAHNAYWRSYGTARLIASNLLSDIRAIDATAIDLDQETALTNSAANLFNLSSHIIQQKLKSFIP
jgi:hypothetical protein